MKKEKNHFKDTIMRSHCSVSKKDEMTALLVVMLTDRFPEGMSLVALSGLKSTDKGKGQHSSNRKAQFNFFAQSV